MIKRKNAICLNRELLKKNDIKLAIDDKRWNALFLSFPKTYLIKKTEKNIYSLMKEKEEIIEKKNDFNIIKKGYLDKIIKLTDKVHLQKDKKAYEEMNINKNNVNKLNELIIELESKIDILNNTIIEKNCDLLEETVYVIYKRISKSKKIIEKIENNITKYREVIKGYIQEKDDLDTAQNEAYKYLHNLIGGEEAEKLDKIYLEEEN